MLKGINFENVQWKFEGTKEAMSIFDILRHTINTEVAWLKRLDDNSFDFIRKKDIITFDDLKERYINQETYYLDRLGKIDQNELQITPMIYEGPDIVQIGTFAWVILKVSIHSFHHAGQISHIRYTLNNPPEQPPVNDKSTWWWASEAIIALLA